MKRLLVPLTIVLALTLTPALAEEDTAPPPERGHGDFGFQSWGVRAGFGSDPDQFLVGAHIHFGEFVPNLRFQPDFTIGFGDDATTLGVGIPVHWQFIVDQPFTPYAGGGLRFSYIDVDLPPGARGDSSDSDLGLEIVGGLEWATRGGGAFFVELKLLTGDIHDFQVVGGWTF